jgi:hypothetical protein
MFGAKDIAETFVALKGQGNRKLIVRKFKPVTWSHFRGKMSSCPL